MNISLSLFLIFLSYFNTIAKNNLKKERLFYGKKVIRSYTHGGEAPITDQGRFLIKNLTNKKIQVDIIELNLCKNKDKQAINPFNLLDKNYKKIEEPSITLEPQSQIEINILFEALSFYPAYYVNYNIEAVVSFNKYQYTARSQLEYIRREPIWKRQKR